MSQDYTPSAVYGSYPVQVWAVGDSITKDTLNDKLEDVYDRVKFIHDGWDLTNSRFNNSLIKLGITVVDAADVALPTYSSGFVLSSAMSHHLALVALDNQSENQNEKITNINTNVGGSVVLGTMTNYSSTNYIVNGESHHISLGKLDTQLKTTTDSGSTSAAGVLANNTKIVNIVSKVGVDADTTTGGFVFDPKHFISDGDTLKVTTEKHDKILLASKMKNHFNHKEWLRNWVDQIGTDVKGSFYEDFYDNTKVHVNTTATIDYQYQKATGNATIYYALFTASASCNQVALRWDASGSVVVKFNCIGSFSDGDMTTATDENTFYAAAAGAGTSIVVKVEITGSIELYNVSALGRNV